MPSVRARRTPPNKRSRATEYRWCRCNTSRRRRCSSWSTASSPSQAWSGPTAAATLILIQGSGTERRNAVDLVLSFDADWMRGQSVGIFPVQNSNPEPIIAELEKIVDSGEGGVGHDVVKFQPIAANECGPRSHPQAGGAPPGRDLDPASRQHRYGTIGDSRLSRQVRRGPTDRPRAQRHFRRRWNGIVVDARQRRGSDRTWIGHGVEFQRGFRAQPPVSRPINQLVRRISASWRVTGSRGVTAAASPGSASTTRKPATCSITVGAVSSAHEAEQQAAAPPACWTAYASRRIPSIIRC